MSHLHLLGIPMDLGSGRRGVDMGPSALRAARLEAVLRELGHTVSDHGNVPVPVAEATEDPEGVRFVDAIAEACTRARDAARELPEGDVPVFLGGDHSVSLGTVAATAARERTGVLWIDAHADLNTPGTSPSGNVHGMPLAALLGHGDPRLVGVRDGPPVRPEDVAIVGLRQADPGERRRIREDRPYVATMTDVDRRGIARIAAEALAHLRHAPRLHVSFDADALDPELAPGVGTPVDGGLTYREAHLLMEHLSDAGTVRSLDLVEVNPILDRRNRTARLLVEMAASLFGKRIL